MTTIYTAPRCVYAFTSRTPGFELVFAQLPIPTLSPIIGPTPSPLSARTVCVCVNEPMMTTTVKGWWVERRFGWGEGGSWNQISAHQLAPTFLPTPSPTTKKRKVGCGGRVRWPHASSWTNEMFSFRGFSFVGVYVDFCFCFYCMVLFCLRPSARAIAFAHLLGHTHCALTVPFGGRPPGEEFVAKRTDGLDRQTDWQNVLPRDELFTNLMGIVVVRSPLMYYSGLKCLSQTEEGGACQWRWWIDGPKKILTQVFFCILLRNIITINYFFTAIKNTNF